MCPRGFFCVCQKIMGQKWIETIKLKAPRGGFWTLAVLWRNVFYVQVTILFIYNLKCIVHSCFPAGSVPGKGKKNRSETESETSPNRGNTSGRSEVAPTATDGITLSEPSKGKCFSCEGHYTSLWNHGVITHVDTKIRGLLNDAQCRFHRFTPMKLKTIRDDSPSHQRRRAAVWYSW